MIYEATRWSAVLVLLYSECATSSAPVGSICTVHRTLVLCWLIYSLVLQYNEYCCNGVQHAIASTVLVSDLLANDSPRCC